MAREPQARETEKEASLVNRRSYLKLIGISTSSIAVSGLTTDSAYAVTNTSGFGEGGFGEGDFGGSTSESQLASSTGEATNITESAATLHGEVTDLGGASSVDVAFEIRPATTTTWKTTSSKTFSTTGTFNITVSNLKNDTSYEFRVIATASDGDTTTGSIRTFSTKPTEHAPNIDYFDVSERGSPNPHAEISVTWKVSDLDADLQTVTLAIAKSDGENVKSYTLNVNGDSNSGSKEFQIKKGGGKKYDCTLSVTDSKSQRTSKTKSIYS